MKEITTKVYTIDELSDEAKEKAREWYKQDDDMPLMEEYMKEQLQDLLAKNKITCDEPKMYYSLSYCQGDGAMFCGTVQWKKYTIDIKHSGHYYHYNSKTFESITVANTGDEPKNYDKVEEAFNEVYTTICKDLARVGYDYIEGERSDESVDENIRANEYTFTESGKYFG